MDASIRFQSQIHIYIDLPSSWHPSAELSSLPQISVCYAIPLKSNPYQQTKLDTSSKQTSEWVSTTLHRKPPLATTTFLWHLLVFAVFLYVDFLPSYLIL